MHITEPERRLPVAAEADVAVIGGGTAGLPAALAAARAGAEVLLIERSGYFGGQASGGLTITIPEDRQGVITNELEERLTAAGGAVKQTVKGENWLVWDPELFKWMSVLMLEEAKVRMLLYTLCAGVIMEGDAARGVIIENRGGRQAVRAKVVIDCTGDADVIALAGAGYKKGDENGAMLPPTMMAMIAGIDESKFPNNSLGLPNYHTAVTGLFPGYVNLWAGRVPGADCTDPWDVTRAENVMRKCAVEAVFNARKNIPGCENAFLTMTATQHGTRETRKLDAEYWITEDDWSSGRIFDDHVGFAYIGKSIPYRSMLPKKTDNLLAAGRCVACVPEIMRLIPSCMVNGYAAGRAAALAADAGIAPRGVDIIELQKSLRADGVPMG